jgi:hypothetical protein
MLVNHAPRRSIRLLGAGSITLGLLLTVVLVVGQLGLIASSANSAHEPNASSHGHVSSADEHANGHAIENADDHANMTGAGVSSEIAASSGSDVESETQLQGEGGGSAKITICHATSSVQNPYVEITVSVHAADGMSDGHEGGDHFGRHEGPVFDTSMEQGDDWGDIIPSVDNEGNAMPLGGMNWPAGQAILEAGCEIPEVSGIEEIESQPSPSPVVLGAGVSAGEGAGGGGGAEVLGETVTPPGAGGGLAFTGSARNHALVLGGIALLLLITGALMLRAGRRQEG